MDIKCLIIVYFPEKESGDPSELRAIGKKRLKLIARSLRESGKGVRSASKKAALRIHEFEARRSFEEYRPPLPTSQRPIQEHSGAPLPQLHGSRGQAPGYHEPQKDRYQGAHQGYGYGHQASEHGYYNSGYQAPEHGYYSGYQAPEHGYHGYQDSGSGSGYHSGQHQDYYPVHPSRSSEYGETRSNKAGPFDARYRKVPTYSRI